MQNEKILLLSILIAASVNVQTYQIGDLIEFPDKTFCVVFYLNQQTGDGLAVLMDEIETQWEAVDDEGDCHNIYKLLDKGNYREFCIPGVGMEQPRLILEQRVRNMLLLRHGALCTAKTGICPVHPSFTICSLWSMPAEATATCFQP